MHEMHSTGRNLEREEGSLIPVVWMDKRNEWRRRKISSCGSCKEEEKTNKPFFVCEGGKRRRHADKERRIKLDPELSLTR